MKAYVEVDINPSHS